MKPINTLCRKDVELLNVKADGTYSYNRALKRHQRAKSCKNAGS
jgi:hypothetical protein